ncbi:hypothetical protein ARAM_004625 [Aspergillus rambellii]|uniref:Chromatin modification-related protein EAF6 n=1 Tax=Aspergillus rambellii TaxID=308745 RepID=A0A0F8V0Q1_9EURO|nr:hypothetical protein ARAM_004625 [Aspergillus rambellii]
MTESAPPAPSSASVAGNSANTPASTATGSGSGTGAGAGTGTGPTSNNAANPNGTANGSINGDVTEQMRVNRGLPYYEKLRRELRDTLQKKRLMDKSMAQLEEQIYRFEQSYLEETTAGNIIKGFDTYIKGSSSGSSLGAGLSLSSGVGTASRRKAQVTDNDRVFSRSSASFMRDSPAPSSAQTTPSHAPTPTSAYNGSTGKPNNGDASSAAGSVRGSSSSKNKKKSTKDTKNEDDGDDDKPPSKRLKISYGRD